MKKVTGGTVPAEIWHEIMLYAHENKQPLPLPGTRMPPVQEASAALPSGGGTPLFRRVFGIFSGN